MNIKVFIFIERCRFSTYYFEKDLTEISYFNKTKLANSTNAKCWTFQLKINCPKFIIDGLKQRCHMTCSISLFVTSKNLLFGVFKENYYNLTKNSHKFQTSVTERCTFLSKRSGMFRQNCFESTWEKNKSLKSRYYK